MSVGVAFPTDALVGTSGTAPSAANPFVDAADTRLTDNRTASGLKSATTTVGVSAATAPSSGQVLVATSSTAATWQTTATAANLALTTNGNGASLVGIEDALGIITGTTVETALAELAKYELVPLTDPGGANAAIPVTRSATVEITTAASETNTLAVPTFLGQRLLLVMDVRAVGNRVITVAARINTAGNTTITLDTAGDAIMLVAIKIGGAFRWQVVFNDGATLS